MGATEEQMLLMSDYGVTHVTYVLLLYSVSFLLYLFVNILLYLYAQHAWPIEKPKPGEQRTGGLPMAKRHMSTGSVLNGNAMGNGHVRRPSDMRRVRDAEAFELEGLISEGEEEGTSPKEGMPSERRA